MVLRLNRGMTLGWGAALVITGAMYGAFAQSVLDAADDLPDLFTDLFGADDLLDGYLGYITIFNALLIASYVLVALQSARHEEQHYRAGPLLVAGISRRCWFGSYVGVTAALAMVIVVAVALATGAGVALSTGRVGLMAEVLRAHLNQSPAIAVILALGAVSYGLIPRWMGWVWVVVGYSFLVSSFGQLLNLPDALASTPFSWLAEMPAEPFRLAPMLTLLMMSIALIAAGFTAFDRRDLMAGR